MVRLKLLLFIVLVLFTNDVIAEDKDHGQSHFGRGGGFEEIKDKLNLTPDQQAKMKEIRKGSKMFTAHKDFMTEKDNLRDLIKKQGSNEADVMTQAEKINKMQSEMNLNRVKNILAFKKILSPEQFNILSEHMEKKRAEFREKFKDRFAEEKGAPEEDKAGE